MADQFSDELQGSGNLRGHVPESSNRLFQDPVFRSWFRIQRIGSRYGKIIKIEIKIGLGHGSSFRRENYICLPSAAQKPLF